METDLFSSIDQDWFDLPGGDGCFSVKRNFLDFNLANQLFSVLYQELKWERESLNIYGKQVVSPRKVAWYGDSGASYQYSGKRKIPLSWHPKLIFLRDLIEKETEYRFNSVLANLYRNGHDSVGWHSDNEIELGEQPVIASLSLGASRFFDYRPIRHTKNEPKNSGQGHSKPSYQKHRIELVHGSMLIMKGLSQLGWQHQVPKQLTVSEPRINLTFRWVYPNHNSKTHL